MKKNKQDFEDIDIWSISIVTLIMWFALMVIYGIFKTL
jgi:hypothetical protein